MKKIEFSLGRCRRMHFWRSHAAWGSQKKTIPMQHGKAETENCDTSRARTSIFADHQIFVVVDFGLFWVGKLAASRGV
jgi:hypothetical protein